MGAFVRVTSIADVKPGHGIAAEVNGKTLAGGNVEGTRITPSIPIGASCMRRELSKGPW
jgi:hypothetical protein